MYSKNLKKSVVTGTIKRDLKELPLAKLSNEFDAAYAAAVEEGKTKEVAVTVANVVVSDFCKEWSISSLSWFWPQALAHIGTWQLRVNEDGLYDPKSLLVDNCKTQPFNKGLYRLCMYKKRGELLKAQTSGDGPYYCSLVPVILAAFKKYHNIPYSKWATDSLNLIVEPSLYEAMNQVVEANSGELLECRAKGLAIKSGEKAGGYRPAASTYVLYGLGKTILGELNMLGQIMYCQTWAAHPSHRNEYMVLDPNNWDKMPDPLIEEDVIATPRSNVVGNISDIDW